MTHEQMIAAVRARELQVPTSAERHGTYPLRTGAGWKVRDTPAPMLAVQGALLQSLAAVAAHKAREQR